MSEEIPYQKIRELFQAALEHPEDERAAFLTGACGPDELLRERVLDLLRRHDEPDSLLDRPAVEAVEAVTLSQAVGPEAEELVMNTGEKLIQKGRQEGMREGRQQGLREALACVLRTRFGDISETVRAQMEVADLETLQRWHGRAVIVESVDEVFGT